MRTHKLLVNKGQLICTGFTLKVDSTSRVQKVTFSYLCGHKKRGKFILNCASLSSGENLVARADLAAATTAG